MPVTAKICLTNAASVPLHFADHAASGSSVAPEPSSLYSPRYLGPPSSAIHPHRPPSLAKGKESRKIRSSSAESAATRSMSTTAMTWCCLACGSCMSRGLLGWQKRRRSFRSPYVPFTPGPGVFHYLNTMEVTKTVIPMGIGVLTVISVLLAIINLEIIPFLQDTSAHAQLLPFLTARGPPAVLWVLCLLEHLQSPTNNLWTGTAQCGHMRAGGRTTPGAAPVASRARSAILVPPGEFLMPIMSPCVLSLEERSTGENRMTARFL